MAMTTSKTLNHKGRKADAPKIADTAKAPLTEEQKQSNAQTAPHPASVVQAAITEEIKEHSAKAAIPAEEDEADAERKITVTIPGEGTMPFHVNGAMRRVDRGVPIKVSQAELDHFDYSGIAYEKGKGKAK